MYVCVCKLMCIHYTCVRLWVFFEAPLENPFMLLLVLIPFDYFCMSNHVEKENKSYYTVFVLRKERKKKILKEKIERESKKRKGKEEKSQREKLYK